MRHVRIWTVLALLGVGCGGGGGGGGSEGQVPSTPGRTPTPLATPSPVATVSLVLTLRATGDVAAASFSLGYEAGRGSFSGTGGQAQCGLGSTDILAVNDDDVGTLRVALLPADPLRSPTLALPTTLTCSFDARGGAVTTADLRIGGKKVGVIDATGVVVEVDASRLDVR